MNFLLDHDVPEDFSYLLEQLGRNVILLRTALPSDASDHAVFLFAYEHDCVLLTCNRDDVLELATTQPHLESLSLSAVERGLLSGQPCFDS